MRPLARRGLESNLWASFFGLRRPLLRSGPPGAPLARCKLRSHRKVSFRPVSTGRSL